jgi:hypothetical protein
MIDWMRVCGILPQFDPTCSITSSADAGYFSEANAEWPLNQGIDPKHMP